MEFYMAALLVTGCSVFCGTFMVNKTCKVPSVLYRRDINMSGNPF